MITMTGHVVGVDIPIVFTGLRPGEKIVEEILTEEEEQTRVVRNKILVAQSPPPPEDLALRLDTLRVAANENDRERIRHLLRGLVPSYRPEAK
jgi:FlaA1/EpsC-like NDP-sugar epimerase